MNAQSRLARRYHWHSANVRDFASDPHNAFVGEPRGEILNLVDRRAAQSRAALLTIVGQPVEDSLDEVRKLTMPAHHDVRASDVDLKRSGAVLAVAHDQEIRNFASLLLVEGLGPRTLQSLALVAEAIHGAPSRFSDPARFLFAHRGKDGHPFPVPLRAYDESPAVLRRSLAAARLQQSEKMEGFRRLDRWTRAVASKFEPLVNFAAALSHERAIAKELGGRTVFDEREAPRKAKGPAQFRLFPDFKPHAS
jgi:hypothetical protein